MTVAQDKPAEKYKGEVSVLADSLIIKFPYNKFKFDQIKSLKEARYDKTQRCWILPIDHLNRLKQLRAFGKNQIKYNLDEEALSNKIEVLSEQRKSALAAIKLNPFSVPQQLSELAQIPIVIVASENMSGVRVKVRRKSRGKTVVEQIPGVSYLSKTREYAFPVEHLNQFLKDLKSTDISFAVEEELGQTLKSTAQLRAAITNHNYKPTWQELRKCLLVPYVKIVANRNGNMCYGLFDWTTEQLRKLVPLTTPFSERKIKSKSLNLDELLSVLEYASSNAINVWLDRETSKELEIYAQQFSNHEQISAGILPGLKPQFAWSAGPHSTALLLLSKTISNTNSELLEQLLEQGIVPCKYSCHQWANTFEIKTNNLLNSLQTVEELLAPAKIVRTNSFQSLISDYESRQKFLLRQQHFMQLKDTEIPEVCPTFAKKLFAHQRVGVAWLLETEAALLGDDMGLGKTLTVLTAFKILKDQNLIDFVCIVCPHSLVRNWQSEAQTWFDDLKIVNLPSTKAAQTKFFNTFVPGLNAVGIAINFETFRLNRIYPELVKLAKNKRVLLVVDESQRVKNPESQAFKALASLAENCMRRVLLSGTPTPNDLSDIWAQMYLLDRGQRLGDNYFVWLTEVAELGNKWSEYAVKRYIPEKVEQVKSRVHEVLLRRKKEDVVDLPPKLFSSRDLELSGSQLERYEEVRKQLLLRVSSTTGDDYYREINSILEEFLRAVQIASNPRLVDPNWTGDPIKFIELDEIVREVVLGQNSKIVIWTNFVNNVKELQQRYSAYGTATIYGAVKANERQEQILAFQSDKASAPQVLIAIPAAGGVGITLTAAKTAVYIDKTWNAEHWLQSIDRIHRIGQTGTVSIISLNACLIDVLIARNLKNKYFQQKDLLDSTHSNISDLPSRAEIMAALETSSSKNERD